MNLTTENVFEGAKIQYNKEDHYIVKVNAKSLYVSKEKDFLTKWESRPKGMTWKNFCKRHNAIMIKYDEAEITKEEAARKDNFIKQKEKKENSKIYLSKLSKKLLQESYNNFLNNKSYSYWIESGSDMLWVILCDESNRMIFRINDKRIIWDMEEDIFYAFKDNEHKKGSEIIWPERIKEGIA